MNKFNEVLDDDKSGWFAIKIYFSVAILIIISLILLGTYDVSFMFFVKWLKVIYCCYGILYIAVVLAILKKYKGKQHRRISYSNGKRLEPDLQY